MPIELNLQGSCVGGSSRGTGLGDCVKQFGDLQGFDLWTKGWSLDAESANLPTETEYKALIQAETVYPFNDLFNFEQNTPDNEFATGSTGIQTEIRAGKPLYSISYDKGSCFHKNLYDKRGKDRWDLSFKFETGVAFATNVAESVLKGFNMGMFSVGTFRFLQGTDPEMSTVIFQFKNAIELNQRLVFYTWEELGYDMNQINGAINAKVSYPTAPVAGTSLSVKVTDDCNRSSTILGLELADFVLGGTQATATTITAAVYNAGTGNYDLTLDNALVAADTVQVSLGSGGNAVAENASGDLYKGSAALATIA